MIEKYIKMEFSSDGDLPLKKALQLHHILIVVRYVFHDVKKYYPQIFLDECLYKSVE